MSSEEAEHEKDKKLLVAAIDFGTTYSGYAFSTREQYQKDLADISTNQKWDAGSMSLISMKAPTAVLFDQNRKFHSFGFEAENKYSELALDRDNKDWFFFKRFKMRLHEIKKMERHTEIEDITGRKMEAKTVFGAAIKYLKKHLLDLLELRGTGLSNDDIHWVITVPAIWTDAAKQFMREAAYEANIDGGQLSIALEPEAASIFCQVSHKDDLKTSRGVKFSLANPGTKYMVIDLGGGTADITVHERQDDCSLKEVHKPTGGPWGGTMVDEEFNQLLIRIIGAPVFQKFREMNVAGYIDLQREFETKKRSITPETDGKVTITVPSKMSMLYLKEMKEEIQDAIDESRYAGKITWDVDKMRLDADIFKSLFKPCTEKLIDHIKKLHKEPRVKGTDIFLMVGGFSESKIMQRAIKDTFKDVTVIVPEDAGLTVVKGAVVFGHHPSVKSRISKYTYGINISPPFDPARHPDDHRVTVGGVDRCRDVFKCYIHEGELIAVNEPRSGKHVTLKPNQKEMLLKVYATEKTNPSFVDEDGVEYIGKLVVNLPDSSQKIRVDVRMMFGKTELTVEAVPTIENGSEQSEKQRFRAYFDFL